MKFGDVPVEEAVGAYLAHSQKTARGVIRKGALIGETEAEALREAGIVAVTAARLEPGDVHEDEAALRLAEAIAGQNVTLDVADTGRCNLIAEESGVVEVDAAAIDRFNAVDPALTVATLRPFERVGAGRTTATVKVIPFSARAESVSAAEAAARGAVRLHPFRLSHVGAISTELPTLKPSVIDKTLRIFTERLTGTGAALTSDVRVPHRTDALEAALRNEDADAVVVFGASAVVDRDDVIPAAIEAAGGTVLHLGMPVDPGNLLVLGELQGRVVIGAPGCARSPKPNGFDLVLNRVLAGLPVSGRDIMGMGVGGLLEETTARPRPRRGGQGAGQRPAAIVLAAGRSTRMGAQNKLLEDVSGAPMVRHVAAAALSSRASPVIVVTGHEAESVRAALSGLDVEFAHNPSFGDGLSTSLRTGLAAVPGGASAALVLLGDMPLVTAKDCDRVLDALAAEDALIALATDGDRRGNPVAWSAQLFPELRQSEGDAGGRALLSRYEDRVARVDIGPAAGIDADTPEALRALRERVSS